MNTDYPDVSSRWVCARKKVYSSMHLAETVARRLNATNASAEARPGFENVVVRAYACTRCGSYHLGRIGTPNV